MGVSRQRAVMAVVVSMVGLLGPSACKPTQQVVAVVDLANAAVDTVLRVDDDRTALVAVASGADGYAVLADTAPYIEIGRPKMSAIRVGASGDGPGEFRLPSGITWSADSIYVWEPAVGRLTLFDRQGKVIGARAAPGASGRIVPVMLRGGYGDVGRIAATPNGVVIGAYAGPVRQPFNLWSLRLVRIRPGEVLDTVPVALSSLEQLGALNDNAQELVATPLWTSCGARGIATWDPVDQKVRRYTAGWDPGRTDSVGGTSVAMTEDMIKVNLRYQLDGLLGGKRPPPAVYDEMIASMLASTRGPRRTYPPTAPQFVSMRCDDQGTIWLQRFSLADAGSGMGRTWTLVDPAGTVGAVRLPAEFRVLAIEGGAVWGVRTDPEGVLLLLKLVLPKP